MYEHENATPTQEGTTSATEGRTFTQDDVNRIVSERLTKERAKADGELTKQEEALRKDML